MVGICQDGEGVVLPDLPGEGREVEIDVAVGLDAGDLQLKVVLIDHSDVRLADSIPSQPQNAQ